LNGNRSSKLTAEHSLSALYAHWKELKWAERNGYIEERSLEDELLAAIPWAISHCIDKLTPDERKEYYRLVKIIDINEKGIE